MLQESSPTAIDAMETLEGESSPSPCSPATAEIKPSLQSRSPSPSTFSEIKTSLMGAGLVNLGNTCFLNAVLQCFTHTVPFVESLRSCDHSASCHRFSGGFCVLSALREHVELSLTSSGRIVSPLKLVENLSNISSSFQRFQQEDAHEFLQCMLDNLQNCCSSLTLQEKSALQEGGFVKQIFGGRLRSQLRCCNCNHYSDTFEPLIDLSLEIEDAETLSTALKSFTQVEKIEDSEMKFSCEKCKEEVSVEKQLTIDLPPAVATFHLKRFKSDGTFVEKISKFVEYPLELDLQPFLSSPNDGNSGELKYDLYAVVVHTGISPGSGHYFCFICSSPHLWHLLDDSKVMRISEEYVLHQEAYILFYKRKGLPWFSSLMETQKICGDLNSTSTSPKSVLDDSERVSIPFSTSMLHESERFAVPLSSSVLDDSSGSGSDLGEAADKMDFNPPTPPPIPSSPSIAPEEPAKVNYSIPRNHLKSEHRQELKKPTNNALDDGGAKEAVNRLLRGMPSSRSSQLLACIAPSRGCHSEGSLNRTKRRKLQQSDTSRSDGEASPASKVTGQSLSPRSVMRGLVSRDSHLLLQFDSC